MTKNIERAKQPIQRNEEMLGIETETLAFVTTYSRSLTFDENYIRKRLRGVQTDRLKKAFDNTRLVFAKKTAYESETPLNEFCIFLDTNC